jgi:hypothetical protein
MTLLQRLEEELDIHQSLSADGTRHPNVLYMDSWFQDESYYYLILEICPHQVRCTNPTARGTFWSGESWNADATRSAEPTCS